MPEQTIKERHAALNKKLNDIEQERSAIKADIQLLQSECDHEHIQDKYGTGHCPDCGFKTRGWFCKTSPTKECDYYDEKEDTYNEDCCIYCGHPEERK